MVVNESRFLKACRCEEVDRTPVWFMRQAGRYLPEYRKIREKYNILEICGSPELSCEVTLMPVRRFDLDAAILFSDIMLPLKPAGIDFEIADKVGPLVKNPIRSKDDIDNLRGVDPEEDLPHVIKTIENILGELNGRLPLIGFAGAPFTLASYLIEGSSSRTYTLTRSLMFNRTRVWDSLMSKLTDIVTRYLLAQIKAGVHAVQLFDSWVGCLSPADYEKYVLPFTRKIFYALKGAKVLTIYFGTNTASLLPLMKKAGSSVIGVDWRVDLDSAWDMVGYDHAIQGNLDPAILFCSPDVIDLKVKDIMKRAAGRPGHIFNLGHGILPNTPIEGVQRAIEAAHKYSEQRITSSE